MKLNEIIEGIAASPGIAIGPVFIYEKPELKIPDRKPENFDVERNKFISARDKAKQELIDLKKNFSSHSKEDGSAEIFSAHMVLLEDPALENMVIENLNAGMNVEKSLEKSTKEIAEMFSNIENNLFSERSADVIDIGNRMLRILLGIPDYSLDSLQTPSILVANELLPSDTTNFDKNVILGIITAAGNITSHIAILSRSMGIPSVVGIGKENLAIFKSNEQVILDGTKGFTLINPSSDKLEKYNKLKTKIKERFDLLASQSLKDAHTANNRRVHVLANTSSLKSVKTDVELGAEGIGLLRTEFLFLKNTKAPSEEEQYELYRSIFEGMNGKPIIIRTYDIGGDKPPSFLTLDEELNPFLGWRGVRLCLDKPELFEPQLRAILRAGHGFDISIMFPMVSSIEELRKSRKIIEKISKEFDNKQIIYNKDVKIGIMIETPSAAVLADNFAEECDFFSIGTNDLTQYVLAVDRTNDHINKLYQPLHPSLLRLIKSVIDIGHQHNIPIGICGELAGMELAIPILIGFKLDDFSMNSRNIPEAKWLIGKLSDEICTSLSNNILKMKTSTEIEDYMKSFLEKIKEDN